MSAEHEIRLQDIRQGPWHEQSQPARERLPHLTDAEASHYLRSHYRGEISDGGEIALRESFDQALEELLLLELAVASGYLPLDAVQEDVRTELDTLLRSDAARAYVKTYDYVPVRFLAARLGMDLGLGQVQPPAVDDRAALRYATFLAVHSDFTSSEPISRFTMLLDDYVFVGRIRASFFKQYLAGTVISTESERAMLEKLQLGLVEFVQLLGDLFLQLREEERALFGCVYAYWLSHFFGVRRIETGYERFGISFEDVARSPLLFPGDMDEELVRGERLRLESRITTLRDVWDRTRSLIESLERA